MAKALFLSFIIGFLAASPLGPIGLLCMRRVLSKGITSGILSALGISFAYAFWSYVSIHGLAMFSYWIERERHPLEIAIGLFFVLYGLNAFFNSPKTEYPKMNSNGGFMLFFSTFLVVFLNPATFVLFSALFTLFGIAKKHFGLLDSMQIALFVFAGTMTFWIAASYLIQNIKSRIDNTFFRKISLVSALAIMAFGMLILLHVIINPA